MTDSEKLRFLESFLGTYKFSSNTKEAEFFCPFCSHHKKKLSINIDTDSFQCWTCSKGGKSLFPLLKQKHANPGQVDQYVNKFKAKQVYVKKTTEKQYIISLPEQYQPLVSLKNSITARRAFKYLKDIRKLSDDTILKHKLGFCQSGEFADRIIVPSFDKDGNLNFYTARSIDDNSPMPYLNDKTMPKGYKNTIIINELNVDFKKPIVITEGYFDLFNSTDNTVALCGSTLSPDSQLFKTLVHNCTDVILALDPDAFFKKTLYIAKMFMKYDLNVFNVDVRPFKDLGKMTKEQAFEKIDACEPIDQTFLFRNKMKKYL